jgi:hypothetical protein
MSDFIESLAASLNARGIEIGDFGDLSNAVERRVIAEYGAVFLNANEDVKIPARCRFENEDEVADFHAGLEISRKIVGGKAIELQKAAMDSLLEIAAEVRSVTPKGNNPARRSFAAVQISWDNAVRAGIDYWRENANAAGRRLSAAKAKTLTSLTGEAQIKMVFELESEGFSFHPERNRSITVYTAIPGASQHLLLLALDIEEYADATVRAAFAARGWFQTVFRDRPHFTYLGLREKDLPPLGLQKKLFEGREFWIPNF